MGNIFYDSELNSGPFANMEEAGLVSYTAARHQGALFVCSDVRSHFKIRYKPNTSVIMDQDDSIDADSCRSSRRWFDVSPSEADLEENSEVLDPELDVDQLTGGRHEMIS